MKLPPTNSITLAPTNAEAVLDRSDPPAPTLDDVIALLPTWVQEIETPVRDAALSAIAAMANRTWARIGQSIARMQTPRNASGPWLDVWGELLKRPRSPGEEDPPYRARLLEQPELISPNAIRDAVETIVAAAIITPPVVMEPATECLFFCSEDPAAPWASWFQGETVRLWGLYPDDPYPYVGAYIGTETQLPEFWIYIATNTGDDLFFLASEVDDAPVFLGSEPGATAYLDPAFFEQASSGLDLTIVTDVESRKMAGVRWWMFIDPALVNAK